MLGEHEASFHEGRDFGRRHLGRRQMASLNLPIEASFRDMSFSIETSNGVSK